MKTHRLVIASVAALALAGRGLAQAPSTTQAPRMPATAQSAATPVPPPPPPLVEIRNLTVRDLRVAYFRIDSAQIVEIEATGGKPQGRSGMRRFFEHGLFQAKEDALWDKDAWGGNAWILDAKTRRSVWELRLADGASEEGGGGLVTFKGTVAFEPGVYEVYYSALYPVSRHWDQERDWRVRTDREWRVEDLRGPYLDDSTYHEFRVAVWAKGQRVTALAAADERNRLMPFSFQPTPGDRQRAGFEVTRPVTVELYGVGEKAEGDWQDYGSIREVGSQRVVWSFRNDPSRAAGGAAKNREVRDTMTLAAGRYLAYYTADDSHHPGEWNETPPRDPTSWGVSVRVVDPKDRPAIKPIDYKPVTGTPIVAFTGLGDDEFRFQGFTVVKPLDIHIFAVGEGSGQVLEDRGWLVDTTGRAIWMMKGDNTQTAGGSTKNRMFDGTVHLEPGSYTAYFVTDGNHSAGGGWNSAEPFDGEYWGMTITAANSAVNPASFVTISSDAAAGRRGPSVLAQIDRVRSDAHERARFHLAADAAVRIRAIGEGSSGDGRRMDDYGWIEDATGRTVWEMKYEDTEPAGGSSKNRLEDAVVRLKAGDYTVHFRTDGSHAFGGWNSTRPDDPLGWGITVTRVR